MRNLRPIWENNIESEFEDRWADVNDSALLQRRALLQILMDRRKH
jgi:hypothetical protein